MAISTVTSSLVSGHQKSLMQLFALARVEQYVIQTCHPISSVKAQPCVYPDGKVLYSAFKQHLIIIIQQQRNGRLTAYTAPLIRHSRHSALYRLS